MVPVAKFQSASNYYYESKENTCIEITKNYEYKKAAKMLNIFKFSMFTLYTAIVNILVFIIMLAMSEVFLLLGKICELNVVFKNIVKQLAFQCCLALFSGLYVRPTGL